MSGDIETTVYTETDEGISELTVRLGEPYGTDDRDFRCDFEIELAGRIEVRRNSWGIDPWQALMCGIRLLQARVRHEIGDATLYWEHPEQTDGAEQLSIDDLFGGLTEAG